ncbi:MAG: SurA N-terminal domain-containing protein [Bacteriovoracaceae bacterium]|nr:SurA N-terminal domain-containing protein [Bacteriovoracaceae bacterium]
MKNLSNKFSYIAISVIMGAIIISFVLTGFQGFGNNPNEVASVGGTTISASEYNQMLNMQLSRYSEMMGGKSLTNQQIKQMKIRESVLQGLIQQKHMLNFANKLGFGASQKHIKEDIKNSKFFQTGDKFDVNRYKGLLQANNISPADYEEDVAKQIKSEKLQELITSIQDSRTLSKDLIQLQKAEVKVAVLTFNKESMTEFLPLSKKEVQNFINDTKNETLLKSLHETYAAQIKAANAQAQAQKSKAKPQKIKNFTSMKYELAKQHLQRTKREELKKFNTKLTQQLEEAFKAGNYSSIKNLAQKYNLNFESHYQMQIINPSFQGTKFNEEEFYSVLKNKNTQKVLKTDNPTMVGFMKLKTFEQNEVSEKGLAQALKASTSNNAQYIQNNILKFMSQNTKVVTSPNLFL